MVGPDYYLVWLNRPPGAKKVEAVTNLNSSCFEFSQVPKNGKLRSSKFPKVKTSLQTPFLSFFFQEFRLPINGRQGKSADSSTSLQDVINTRKSLLQHSRVGSLARSTADHHGDKFNLVASPLLIL